MPNGNQIEVDIRADTSQARQALNQLTQDLSRLKAQVTGVPGSPPMLFGASGQKYIQDPTTLKLLPYTQELKEAQKELGDEIEKTGNKTAGMVGHMIAMGLAFKAVEVSAKSLIAAVAEPLSLEKAQNQFKALTASGQAWSKEMKIADEVARATGTDLKELYPAILKLEDAAIGPDKLKDTLLNAAQAAKDTGVPLQHIVELSAKVNLNEATIPQLREAAHLTGQWKEENLKLVGTYESLQKTIPMVEKAQEAVNKATRQMGEEIERTTEVHASFYEKLVKAGPLAQDPYAGFDPIFRRLIKGIGPDTSRMDPLIKAIQGASAYSSPVLAARALMAGGGAFGAAGQLTGPGGVPLPLGVPKDVLSEYQRGLQQIRKEEELSNATLQNYLNSGVIGYHDIREAAKRAHAEDLRGLDQSAEAQKLTNQLKLEGAKTTATEAIAKGLVSANAQAKEFEEHSKTISGWWEKTAGAFWDAYQHGAGIQATLGILSLGQLGQPPMSPAGGFKGGSASLLDQLRAALGISTGPQGKVEMTETNSAKIAGHLSDLVDMLRGGT